jgi:hypothetical protein
LYGPSDAFKFPTLHQTQRPLDELVLWTRKVISEVEIQQQHESEFELTVYIRQPDGLGNHALTEDAYLNVVRDHPDNPYFELNLRDYFAPCYTSLKVKGVAISLAIPTPEHPTAHMHAVHCAIFPPVQVVRLGALDLNVPREPMIVSHANLYNPSQIEYKTSPSINNIDPRGTWGIRMARSVLYPDVLQRPLTTAIADVKLHLLLVGRLSTDKKHWDKFVG